jgi:hypothetical protein
MNPVFWMFWGGKSLTRWEIKGREFGNCNCAYGCPCQFNALPTHGHCRGLAAFVIDAGFHGHTRLDGMRAVSIFRWPGPIHEGRGESIQILEPRATPEQRDALLRVLQGHDTEPGATVFQVFASTCEKFHDPILADIEIDLDVDARSARVHVGDFVEMRGEPILNPVSGEAHRVRIEQPNGFEFAVAEIGRGWSKIDTPIAYELADSYGQFANIHLCQSGMVR